MSKMIFFYIVKKELSLFVIALCSFLSCDLNRDNSIIDMDSGIKIKIEKLDDLKTISASKDKYFKSFRRIQLESDTNMLIGNIDQLVLTNNRIYIMDSRITHSLFVFSKDGSFVNKISAFGQGPEEYVDMRDMFYDSYENTINLISWVTGNRYKIMSFDKDGSKLVKQMPIDLRFNEAERTNDGLYVFHSKNSSNLPNIKTNISVYSKTLQRLYDGLPISLEWLDRGWSARSDLYKDKNGNVYCTSEYTTDVYQIMPDSLQLCYQYDFGKYTYPDEFKTPERVSEMARNFQINNYVTGLRDFYEGENFVISCILFKGSYRMIAYDKVTNEVNVYDLLDNPFASDSFGSFVCFSGGCAVASLSAESFVELFENPSIFRKKAIDDLKRQFERPIKSDDNPILYIYEFAD